MSDMHNRAAKQPPREDEDDGDMDPVDRMLKKAGCLDLHYKVQECMVDHKDWRKCKDEVQAFKKCVAEDRKRRGLD